jgi:hypothetical protein
MKTSQGIRKGAQWLAAGVGLAATSYAAYVGVTFCRYGRGRTKSTAEDADPLLDQFIPEYDLAERHHVRVAAPAEITFAAAKDMDLRRSAVVRSIFRTREMVSTPPTASRRVTSAPEARTRIP